MLRSRRNRARHGEQVCCCTPVTSRRTARVREKRDWKRAVSW